MSTPKLKDFREGDFVTSTHPLAIFGSVRGAFTPGKVGSIAHISICKPYPADFIVDFYDCSIPYEPTHQQVHIYRCRSEWTSFQKVTREQAQTYLEQHAPTWEEVLEDLTKTYTKIAAWPLGEENRPALSAIARFLQEGPTQDQVLAFLPMFQQEYAYHGEMLQREVSTLGLTNIRSSSGIRIPWIYKMSDERIRPGKIILFPFPETARPLDEGAPRSGITVELDDDRFAFRSRDPAELSPLLQELQHNQIAVSYQFVAGDAWIEAPYEQGGAGEKAERLGEIVRRFYPALPHVKEPC